MNKESEHCENCLYWKSDDRKATPHMGTCSSEKWEEGDDDMPDGVSYTDYEGYSAMFKTGQDFGCIHFKVKPIPMK